MSQDDPPALGTGEAYRQCVRELHQPHPDYERAQVFATLALHEAVRGLTGEVSAVGPLVQAALTALRETIAQVPPGR
jgi:hypothetical protein